MDMLLPGWQPECPRQSRMISDLGTKLAGFRGSAVDLVEMLALSNRLDHIRVML
jgi:hypothetical protein